MSENAEKLISAAKKGDVEQISSLITAGIFLNAEVNGRRAIHWAALHGHVNVMGLLLSSGHVEVDFPDIHGNTALHYAVRHGHYSVVELLVWNNANSNYQDTHMRTALHVSVKQYSNCGNHECLKYIEKKCERIHLFLKDAPFQAMCGHLAIAAFLVAEGNADVTIRDRYGKAPFDVVTGDRAIIANYWEKYGNSLRPSNVKRDAAEFTELVREYNVLVGFANRNDIINKWKHLLEYCKKIFQERDKTIVNLQSSVTLIIKLSEENTKAAIKEKDREIARNTEHLSELSITSRKLNASLDDKNKEVNHLSNQIKEKDMELERKGRIIKSLEEALVQYDWMKVSCGCMKIAFKKDEDVNEVFHECSTTFPEEVNEKTVAAKESTKKLTLVVSVSEECNTDVNDGNNKDSTLKYPYEEKCHDLEIHKIKLEKTEQRLRKKERKMKEKENDFELMQIELKNTKKSLSVKEKEVSELRKLFSESATRREDKQKAMEERATATLKGNEREITTTEKLKSQHDAIHKSKTSSKEKEEMRTLIENESIKLDTIHDIQKRINYLESFHLCSKCREPKISFVLLCGHTYCDSCYDRYGDSCSADKKW